MKLTEIRSLANSAARGLIPVIAVFAAAMATQGSVSAAVGLYAQTTATQSYTTFVGPIPIDGLSLNLPAATAAFNAAIVTLSMPNLRLTNPTSKTEPMSAEIQVVAPFSPAGVVSAFGGIGCDTTGVAISGLKPLTIVIEVPLGTMTQPVEGEWDSTAGTVSTEQFASISAILVRR